jgi:flavin reductase (DIM6/NTAB) family NADH-FMN oxidoreductase RutF
MDKTTIGPRPYTPTMPAVLVGSSVKGKPNYMAVAWTGLASMDPPMVTIAINKVRHTDKGILENKTFSINIPSAKHVQEMDYCGLVSGGKVDKSKVFDSFYGKLGTAPLISEFPVNIECSLRHTLDFGTHNLHAGQIVEVHVATECMTDGQPDLAKIDPVVFAGQNYCHVGEIVARAFSVGKGYKA